MANVDNPRGFTPVNLDWSRVHRYYKSAAVILAVGDPVVRAADSTDPQGEAAVTRSTTGSYVTGVIVGIEEDPNRATKHLAAGDKGYVLVADDPMQEFVIQDNGAAAITIANMGEHIDHVAAIDADTVLGRSKYELDAAALASGNTWILMRKDKDPNNEVGANCDWIVKANLHTEVNAGATNVVEI